MMIGPPRYSRLMLASAIAAVGLVMSGATTPAIAAGGAPLLVLGEALPAPLQPVNLQTKLVTAGNLAAELGADGVKMIYLDANAESFVPQILDHLPTDSAALIVVGQCGITKRAEAAWTKEAERVPDARLILPADGPCDRAALTQAFAKSLNAANIEPALIRTGFRSVMPKPVAPKSPTLVITALPVAAASGNQIVLTPAPVSTQVIPATDVAPPVATKSTAPSSQPAPEAIDGGPDGQRTGGPEPSIVIGDMAVLVATGEPGPLGIPFQTREAIRARDPAMFERLLTRGAFDPAEAQAVAAIQTELKRMGCYPGTVDGSWGKGSNDALQRYASAAKTEVRSTEPGVILFRAVARGADVKCAAPTPVAVRPNPTNTAGSRGGSQPRGGQSTRPRPTAPARATAPRNPPAQTAPAGNRPQISPGVLGAGVFR